MSSITYSERIKIETFCELGLSNIQMGVRLNRSPSTISYELSRCQPYQAELAQTDAEYKRSRCGRKTKLSDELKQKSGEAYADKYKTIAEKIQISSKIDNTYFNFKNIGISLISGGVSYGALAFLATQIPSNLGLYLGIGSIGGTLTSMGLIASPIVLTTAVAATGGPIVWGIGLAIFASSLVMAIFGKSTWKKKLAQKINKDFEKIDALNKYEQAINGFWKDTIIGVRKNREAMDKVAEDQANKITHMVDFEGDDYLDKLRNGLNDLKKLLMN